MCKSVLDENMPAVFAPNHEFPQCLYFLLISSAGVYFLVCIFFFLYKDFITKISTAGQTPLYDCMQQMRNYIRNNCELRC